MKKLKLLREEGQYIQLGDYVCLTVNPNEKETERIYNRLLNRLRHYLNHSGIRRKLRGQRYTVEFKKLVKRAACNPLDNFWTVGCKCTIKRRAKDEYCI